jgi:hypothetical protein
MIMDDQGEPSARPQLAGFQKMERLAIGNDVLSQIFVDN